MIDCGLVNVSLCVLVIDVRNSVFWFVCVFFVCTCVCFVRMYVYLKNDISVGFEILF